MLFSEPKIPQSPAPRTRRAGRPVSVLFSEPKIPQSPKAIDKRELVCCFSALQRAENSSIGGRGCRTLEFLPFQCSSASRKFLNCCGSTANTTSQKFQCSSASRKFLNAVEVQKCDRLCDCFSALQRAENSSMLARGDVQLLNVRFQCSSASRKFLNNSGAGRGNASERFQCSSASRKFLNQEVAERTLAFGDVSVLFSEPKIPQSLRFFVASCNNRGFSALQRAENSSIQYPNIVVIRSAKFQCSSASRKFLN